MRIGSQTEVDATHWVLLGLTIPMAIAFGLMMPKNSVNIGPEFAMAYLAAMIFVFVGLEHIFDHRAAVFAAVVCGSLDFIVVLPVALLVPRGPLKVIQPQSQAIVITGIIVQGRPCDHFLPVSSTYPE
jgi:hypothetical protein